MQCNYCDRKYSCVNESRPGVTCTILRPQQALEYVRRFAESTPNLSVVGIAGPGDPFANPDETMETLRLVHDGFPELLLCVATNGLNLIPYIDDLARIRVSHVTLTVNAVDPEIGKDIYEWMRCDGREYRGVEAAQILWERQQSSIQALRASGVMVKINSIYVPGVNDHHIAEVARTVSALGADYFNIMPLYPTPNTQFASIKEPNRNKINIARMAALAYLPQMSHCSRCRADAAGLLGKPQTFEQVELLQSAARVKTCESKASSCASGACNATAIE
jgi:nitrogen fixation protein NifB